MSINSELLKIRIDLDEAITYGDREDAIKIARKGLARARESLLSGEVQYFLGQIELLKENYKKAIQYFDQAVKHNPKDGAAYNDRALCMVEMGIIDEAFIYFDKGIEVEPDYATIYHNKGWLLNNIGRYTEAIVYFKKALSLEPQRAVTYDNLADALFNLGVYAKALSAYRRVLELLKPGYCQEIKEEILEQIKLIEEDINKSKRK